MKIAMFGHKRIPSREGGVEIVVEELAKREAALGNEITVITDLGIMYPAANLTVR